MRTLLRPLLARYDRARNASRDARALPDAAWRDVLATYQIPVAEAVLETDGRLSLPSIGIAISKDEVPTILLRSYVAAVDLTRQVGAAYSNNGQGTLARIRGVTHAIETCEDFFILKEIYQHGAYDCSTDAPLVIVDVGANVGFTTLFFAAQFPDSVIEGFEPVPTTYGRALRNLALNPELAARITLHNYGLAASDSEALILLDRERPGNATLIKDNCFTASVAEQVPVALRRSSTVLREVRRRHPGRRMILKLDCEGSEYQILEELESTGALHDVDCVLAEWHRVSDSANCDWLCRVLGRNGFFVCASDRFCATSNVGMLHAVRIAEK